MCEIATGLAILSTLVGAAGTMQQAKAASESAKYDAKVSDMNAKLSRRRSQDALERGRIEEQEKRKEVAQLKGRQQAALAANGVDIGYGSPLDTLVDTAVMGELDALTVRSNAAREAYSHDLDAENGVASASLSRANAKNARSAGLLATAGTLIGGTADAWKTYRSRKIGVYA